MNPTRILPQGLAYGCWRLAGSEARPRGVDPEVQGRAAVHAAIDAGYTVFDLADIYGLGECERVFGEALAERPGVRDRLFVVSKCGIRRPGTPAPGDPARYDFSASYLMESVEGSLKRMKLETLDLLLLHRPDYLMDPAEVAGAFLTLRDAGKVRSFGVSNFRPSQLTALQQACPLPLVVNQIEFSLAYWGALDDGTLDQCLLGQVTPMAWSPLGRGVLGDGDLSALAPAERQRIEAIRGALDGLAAAHGVSRAVVALAWVMRHPAGAMPVVGSVNPARIAEMRQAETLSLGRVDWYRLYTAARTTRLP
jgi:predicted oxidoreductase